MKKNAVNQYTPEGRELVHKNLTGISMEVLYYMMRNPVIGKSIEYNDNRFLYCGQQGKCAITGIMLQIHDIHCHHKLPINMGGTDKYENLILVTQNIHTLLHATQTDTITELLKILNLDSKQKNKVNYLRKKLNLAGI